MFCLIINAIKHLQSEKMMEAVCKSSFFRWKHITIVFIVCDLTGKTSFRIKNDAGEGEIQGKQGEKQVWRTKSLLE